MERGTKRVFETQIRGTLKGARMDTLFFTIGGILAVWYAILLLNNSFGAGWSLVLLIPFWAVTAYLTLPRLHRILTSIYVPDYFFGRSRTSEGMLGDPVNLAFHGSAAQIHEAMTAAGWQLADDVNFRSSWRIVVASVLRKSYPTAPVSPLFLFGRKQDLAYQQEVEGNPSQRHHLRIWRCPDDWPLPGGKRVGWLGAGTFDTAVGLSLFTLQITHRIDADIDVERDYITDSVTQTHREISLDIIEDFSSSYHHRNGGGDRVHTDGDLPILDMQQVQLKSAVIDLPAQVRRAARGFAIPDGPCAEADEDAADLPDEKMTAAGSTVHRPWTVKLALAMLIISLLAQMAALIHSFATGNPTPAAITGNAEMRIPDEYAVLAVLTVIGVMVLMAVLMVLTIVGFQLPRVLLMALLAVMLTIKLLDGTMPGPGQLTVHLLITSVHLLALLALSADNTRIWSRRGKPTWRDVPEEYENPCEECTE